METIKYYKIQDRDYFKDGDRQITWVAANDPDELLNVCSKEEYDLCKTGKYNIPNIDPSTGQRWASLTVRDAYLHKVVEETRLLEIIKNGEFNTALTTYFNSIYRRATNLNKDWTLPDGTVRTSKQVQNSISAIAVDSKYIIAYEGTDDFIALPDGQMETYLKDVFVVEEQYKTSKEPEWKRLVKILTVQEVVEEHFKDPSSTIISLIHRLININMSGHPANPINGINWGALVSGGTE